MKIGLTKRKPGEIKDQLVQVHRAYREGKEKAIDGSIAYAESRTGKLFAPLFICILLAIWLGVIFWEAPQGKVFDTVGDFPKVYAVVIFFVSYFAFFHSSKLIFKPSDEEIADDTSHLALFSACPARERRGLFSAAFGLANTVAFVACVILKQTGLDAWRLF